MWRSHVSLCGHSYHIILFSWQSQLEIGSFQLVFVTLRFQPVPTSELHVTLRLWPVPTLDRCVALRGCPKKKSKPRILTVAAWARPFSHGDGWKRWSDSNSILAASQISQACKGTQGCCSPASVASHMCMGCKEPIQEWQWPKPKP